MSRPSAALAGAITGGRRVVVTGGTSGIGAALTERLRARGDDVTVAGRRALAGEPPGRALDLASLLAVDSFTAALAADGRAIDLLVLAAGVHVPWNETTTADGHELHWQVNYLANVLLVHRLLDRCLASSHRQIVYVASEAHRLARVGKLPPLGFWRRYAESKAAAISFFLHLQRRHPELRVRIVSPGYVDTPIHAAKRPFAERLERAISRVRTAAAAAAEIVDVLEAGDGHGIYWNRGRPAPPSAHCLDEARAESLWRASLASLAAYLPPPPPCAPITNYARTWRGFGPCPVSPADVDELAAIVRDATEAGRRVRVVGARHSYNDSFYSSTTMVSLDRLTRIEPADAAAGTITCEGGATIDDLCAALDRDGLALRYCGNHGRQTVAGALATGTHGYGRSGGVMSELITAMTVMLPDGRLLHTADEHELRALRLGLGSLGVVVDVTLAIERSYPVAYRVASLPRAEFVERLDELADAHDYLRFMPHPFDDDAMLRITIDRAPHDTVAAPMPFIGAPAGGAAWLLVPWLRMPAVRRSLGRALRVSRHDQTSIVPFSTSLFVRAGVAARHAMLARIGQRALDRNDWLNMELAIPRARFAAFAHRFAELAPPTGGFSGSAPYYTCRAVGASCGVLLGPNHGRDVIFVDVHAAPRAPWAAGFLRALERVAIDELEARPHWGKLFFAEAPTLRSLYPAANIDAFLAIKGRLDPRGTFSNGFSRRVLGV